MSAFAASRYLMLEYDCRRNVLNKGDAGVFCRCVHRSRSPSIADHPQLTRQWVRSGVTIRIARASSWNSLTYESLGYILGFILNNLQNILNLHSTFNLDWLSGPGAILIRWSENLESGLPEVPVGCQHI